MKRKRALIAVLLVLAAAIFLISMGAKAYIEANLKNLANMNISDVDLSKARDGIYEGSYKAFPIAAEVEVEISNHRIKEIILKKHNNGQGQRAEAIPEMVAEAQTLEVDTVAGATYSSKVILKAIENALERAVE